MIEYPKAEQTPEDLRAAARLLLERSKELREMADDLMRHGEALLTQACWKNGAGGGADEGWDRASG